MFSQILNYKTCLYNFVSLHKKIPKILLCLQNTTIHIKKHPHVFSQILNHKTCLYNFVSFTKKYQRSQCVYKTLRFISKKILMCSHKYLTIKPVYTTLCLYTKKYQRSQCVYKTLRSKKHIQKTKFYINQSYVIKHLNPSNYKTCLYNFVSLHKKIPKIPMCLQNTTIHIKKTSSCVLINT